MAKRNYEVLSGYVQHVSPSKKNFQIRIQNAEGPSCVRAICFDRSKRNVFEEASITGDPVKIQNILRQESKNKHFAEYVINHRTSVQKVDPLTVKFQRSEAEVHYVKINEIATADVKSKIGIKAKLDLSHSCIKNVTWGDDGKVSRVLNDAYLYTEGASVKLTLWEDWIDFFKGFHGKYLDVSNLVVNEYGSDKYVSTCAETSAKEITDMPTPDYDLVEELPILLEEFDTIHKFSMGYECQVCSNIVKVIDESSFLKCERCSTVQRSSGMSTKYEVEVAAKALGHEIFKLDLKELKNLIGDISFNTDETVLIEKLMQLTDLFVKIDKRSLRITVVN